MMLCERWSRANKFPASYTRKTCSQSTTKVKLEAYTALPCSQPFLLLHLLAQTPLFEKHVSHLGRWSESCQELHLSGSWEPAAAGCTERSRLPTLLRWHRLLLYLHKATVLLQNKG